VNNAGVSLETSVAAKGLRTIYEQTFRSAAITAESFLSLLKKSKSGGRIVNIGFGAGSLGMSVRNWTSENFSSLMRAALPRFYIQGNAVTEYAWTISRFTLRVKRRSALSPAF